MAVSSVYPAGIKVFPTWADLVDVVLAVDSDSLAAEITSIETVIGPNPTQGFSANTISGVLNALAAGKSNSTHTHANLTSSVVTLGSPTGQTITVSGNIIQALLAGANSGLQIQPGGGDTLIGSSTNNTALFGSLSVVGNANFAATVSAPNFYTSSSLKVKDDIVDLEAGVDALMALRPVSYVRRSDTTQRRHGLIAEEVDTVLPEVLGYDAEGAPAGIDYGALVPLLIKVVQAQERRIAELEKTS